MNLDPAWIRIHITGIYNTTGPCMQYSTGPCTTVPCILYYWPMFTVINVPVQSTSDMCIQYFWPLYMYST